MTKQEFDAIVNDAVKNGADRKAAEAYVVAGYRLDAKDFESQKPKAKAQKPK